MQGTENYGLYLTDDSKVKFREWREKMNGVNDSNMIRIDAILAEKAIMSIAITKILSADGWENAGTAFTQEIIIEGLTAEQNYQLQYDCYRSGNSAIAYNHADLSSAVWW